MNITESEIKTRLIEYKAQARGTKPYRYDIDIVVNNLMKRINNDSHHCKTVCPDDYLQRTAKNIGIRLKPFDKKAFHDKKKKVNQDILTSKNDDQPKIIQSWNRLFLFPIVLRRAYA
jgi:hypothetical protein